MRKTFTAFFILLTLTVSGQSFVQTTGDILANTASVMLNGVSRISARDANPVAGDANIDAFNITGQTITLEAWIFLFNLPGDNSTYEIMSRISYYQYSNYSYSYSLQIGYTGDSDQPQYIFVLSTNSSPGAAPETHYLAAQKEVEAGTWCHLAGTYDGTSMKIYFNGNMLQEERVSGTIVESNTGFYIGGSNINNFNGIIDEARLWNVARSLSEINDFANNELSGTEVGLAGYWPFNGSYESNGSIISEDVTSNHNHLRLVNGAEIVGFPLGDQPQIPASLIEENDLDATSGENFVFTPIWSGYQHPSFAIEDFPEGMTCDETTGVINWTPSDSQLGFYSFTITTQNNVGGDLKNYTVFVNSHLAEEAYHDNNNLKLSIFNDGTIGGHSVKDGVGLLFNDIRGLFEADLILGTESEQVSGMLYKTEFARTSPIARIEGNWDMFDLTYLTAFNDSRADNPIGVTIYQRSYSKSTDPDKNYIIMRYDIQNTGSSQINNLYCGLALDFDVGDASNDKCSYDESRRLYYVHDSSQDNSSSLQSYYYGLVYLSELLSGHRAWINSIDFDEKGNQSYYDAMTNFYDLAIEPGDLRLLVGTGPYILPVDKYANVVFAFVAGSDLTEIQNTTDAVIEAYKNYKYDVKLISPNGGEILTVGSDYEIKWESQNVNNLTIAYQLNEGGTWNEIANSVDAASGSYLWTVPDSPSEACRVGISTRSNLNINDVSDGFFRISHSAPNYTVELVADDFNDGNADGWELGSGWRVERSDNNYYLASNEAFQTSFIGSTEWTNYSVQTDVELVDSDPVFLWLRQTGDALYKINLSRESISLSKAIGSLENEIAAAAVQINYNEWNNIKVILQEGYLWIYLNDVLVLEYTDSDPILNGRVGFQSGSSGKVRFDNINIRGELILNIDPQSRTVTSSSGNTTFNIISNSAWTVSENLGWLEPDRSAGEGSVSITVTYNENTSLSSRTGVISVSPSNTTSSTAATTFTITQQGASYPENITINNSFSFPFHNDPADYTSSDYKLIGLPGNSNRLISSFLTGDHETDWEVYWDNGDPAASPESYYVQYNGSNNFRCSTGKAFWVIQKSNLQINESITAVSLNNNLQAEVPIIAGRWNLITNPFTENVSWEEVTLINGSLQNPVTWDGNSMVVASQLEPYKGYIFNNTSSTSTRLLIPYPVSNSLNKNKDVNEYNWLINVNVSSGGFSDKTTQFGLSDYADNGFDEYDHLKARVFADIPISYFEKPEWTSSYPCYRTDIRHSLVKMSTWELKVRSNGDKEVELSFELIQDIPVDYDVYLLSEFYGSFQNLRTNSVFKFNPVNKITDFQIIVGTYNSVQEEIRKVVPDDFELLNNYPNPFNAGTIISVTIPEMSSASLEIYNILGQKIKTLFEGTLNTGKHHFNWRGEDDYGGVVTSGIYFYKLHLNNGKVFTRKMVMLK